MPVEETGKVDQVKDDAPPRGAHLDDMVDGWKRSAEREAASAPPSTPRGNSERAESGDWLNASLLRQARAAGFSEEEARDWGSPERLQRALTALDREILSNRRGQRHDQDRQPPPREQTPPRREERPPPPRDDQPRDQQGRFISREKLELEEFDEDLVDASVSKNFTALREHYEKRIARLEEALEVAMPALSESYEDTRSAKIAAFDAAIAGLDEAYLEILGEGDTADLDPESDHYRSRDRVFSTALELRDELKKRGRKVPRWEELVRRAAHLEYGEKVHTRGDHRDEQVAARQKESTFPPSHRNGRSSTPSAKGGSEEKQIADFWKSRGFDYQPRKKTDSGWLPPDQR
jgi:hypothetical protein